MSNNWEVKGAIRDSEINGLLQRVRDRKYKQYLSSLTIKKLRGFQDIDVSFDFPVTALIGPNGGGKTTVLGAAAIAYEEIRPRRFFAKSGEYDESMKDWSIEYNVIDQSLQKASVLRRTATFKAKKWDRKALPRPTKVFGVERTVPANEKTNLQRCQSNSFSVPNTSILNFTSSISEAASRILGKDVSGFKSMKIDRAGRIQLLTGETGSGDVYSEFHFGAGESSVLRMIAEIETVDDYALILIEEIENGLHPVATQKLVEYLISVAQKKNHQIIFTTHSDRAINVLPNQAVWTATQTEIVQGKIPIDSLRAITGQIESEAVAFVEDRFAERWLQSILRQQDVELLDRVEVHALTGDGAAVKMTESHNKNPTIKTNAVAVLDGDASHDEDISASILKLPGGSPEATVFDQVLEKWREIGGRVAVAMSKRFEDEERIRDLCVSVRRDCLDHHLLFASLGRSAGLVPEITVAEAFTNQWAQAYETESREIAAKIREVALK